MDRVHGWRGVLFGLFGLCGLLGAQKADLAECNDPLKFSDKQKDIIVYAYRYGFKQELGYEMAAIAWKESCAGMYRVNFGDPSAGIYHAYIPAVIKLYNERDTRFMQNVYGDMLIRDRAFASKVALDMLVSWRRTYKGNLKDMIKSYHKGLRWQKNDYLNQVATEYYQDILAKIKVLRGVMPALEQSVDTHNNPEAKHLTYAQNHRPIEVRPKGKNTKKRSSHSKPSPHKKPTPPPPPPPPQKIEPVPQPEPVHKKRKDNSIFLLQESPVF
ncbi:hypothetical protein [Helicobacter felis]|uniref:Transglycosylase SLT domain-containing protein n=3 Tax=Helicobacter felis TaxID=214 RepID=E7ACM1_HELFC|nr:hypothetical protein [Helicobacter felis]CBY83052.1 Putative hypothetical protein [Helicobacter felis ATCC 49179]